MRSAKDVASFLSITCRWKEMDGGWQGGRRTKKGRLRYARHAPKASMSTSTTRQGDWSSSEGSLAGNMRANAH